jgi:lipopolysaccharide assembly outer membrane protein LptD (OstA)
MKKLTVFFIGLCLLWISFPVVFAQQPSELNVEADQVNFENEAHTVTARGNVRLRKGPQSLSADVVTYNTATEQAFARGNVVFTNRDQIWRGETLQYNFITGKGSFPSLTMESEPFTLNAESMDRLGPVHTQLQEVTITTCPITTNPEFFISSSRVDVYEDSIFVLRNPVFFLHGIPFLYLPRLVLDQERQPTNIDVIPGYSSRDGFSLLTSYNRYPSDGYRTKTHLDYRSERGIGLGQDFFWYVPDNLQNMTFLKLYGTLDDAPYRNETQETQFRERGIDIDEERYRVKFSHRQQLTPNDTLWANVSYWSDAKVTEDFFREDFRQEPVPETRVVYSALGDGWNANIEAARQLNQDEFSSVNRLPEASFNMPLRQLDQIDLLYEGSTQAGFMERTFSKFERDENARENFDSLRVHTDHMLFYPTRHFGWLNVIPRAGGKATYYGNTRSTESRIVPVSTVGENNIITTTFETETIERSESADMRILPELGLETSFKAFGIVHNQPTGLGRGLRHVVEPFTNYTFIPEPDLTSDQIYQFDRIDDLGEEHNLAFGVRNKWQTRRARADGSTYIHDLLNVSVSSFYDLRSDADPHLGNVLVDTELKLVDWARARVEFLYDTDESEINTVFSELRFEHPDSRSWISLDQRFRKDDTHTVQLNYRLNTRSPIGLEGYTRFELEDDGMEEQDIMLTFETDCVGYGFGGRWRRGDNFLDGTRDDDDYEIWFQLWLTAFPRAILGSGGR